MADVHVSKARAGSDSAGNLWAEDGAVLPVPYEHALVLAAIPDGGFAIVEGRPNAAEEPAENTDSTERDSDESAKPSRRKPPS